MPRTISGNGPWTVSSNAGFPWLPAAAAVAVVGVVVFYGHQITRVAHDALLVAVCVAGGVVVAGTVTGLLVWRWRHGRAQPALTEEAAHELGLDTVRAGWPFVKPDGTPIELPRERAR